MPHNYNSLRRHIASIHPDILELFEQGWENLGAKVQKYWENLGICRTQPAYDHQVYEFQSWTHVRHDEAKSHSGGEDGYSILRRDLSDFVREKLRASDNFYDIPELTGFKVSAELHWSIANSAVEAMLEPELKKICIRLKNEIEKDGLDAVRKYFPVNSEAAQ
jgi:hypothetical protein